MARRVTPLFTHARRFLSSSAAPILQLTPQLESVAEKIVDGNLHALSRAITLCESTKKEHRPQAAALLQRLLSTVRSRQMQDGMFTVGVTGPPGAGKSSVIERIGLTAAEGGRRVAVLAIDPSSQQSGGSILGDKTRMAELSCHPNAFIRPTPTRGEVGGLARNTADAALLCEASGCDLLLIETVGGGQADVAIAQIVDMVLLVLPPSGGDELQGIKKGIVEHADLIAINKADGAMQAAALASVGEYASAMHFVRHRYPFWASQVVPCSARTGTGIEDIFTRMMKFRGKMSASGMLVELRSKQRRALLRSTVESEILMRFHEEGRLKELMSRLESEAARGEVAGRAAAQEVVNTIFGQGGTSESFF